MKDTTAPKVVEVTLREDGTVLWVNVDGVCALRVCRIPAGGLVVTGPFTKK